MSWQYSNPLGEALLASNTNLYANPDFNKGFNPITTRYVPSKPGLLNRPKPNSLGYLDDDMDELSLELATNSLITSKNPPISNSNSKFRANPYDTAAAPYVPSYYNDAQDSYLDPAYPSMANGDSKQSNGGQRDKKANKQGAKMYNSDYDLSKLSQPQIPQQLPDGPMKKPRMSQHKPARSMNGYDSTDDADMTDLDTPHQRAHKRLNMSLLQNTSQTPRKINSHPLASNRNQQGGGGAGGVGGGGLPMANRNGGAGSLGPSSSVPSLHANPAQHNKSQLIPQQQQIGQQLTPNFLRNDPSIPVMTSQPYVATIDPYGNYNTAAHNGMIGLGGLNTYQPYMVTSPSIQLQADKLTPPDPTVIKQQQNKNLQQLQQLQQQQHQQQLQLQQLQNQLAQKQQQHMQESLNLDQPQSHLEMLKIRQQQERQRLLAEAEKAEAANQQQQRFQKQSPHNSNGGSHQSNPSKNMARSMLPQAPQHQKQYSETSIPSTNADPLNSNSPTPPITRRNKPTAPSNKNQHSDSNFKDTFQQHMNGSMNNHDSKHYMMSRKTEPEDNGPGIYFKKFK